MANLLEEYSLLFYLACEWEEIHPADHNPVKFLKENPYVEDLRKLYVEIISGD